MRPGRKTLADHRADRKTWLLDTLGLSATDPAQYTWEPVATGYHDHVPTAQGLLHVGADRLTWRQAPDRARARGSGELPATGRAA